jgi:tetratricopeptide (TPR) repeat protein
MTTVPPEPQVRELLDLGLAHVPEGDSEEQVRLLGVRAGWPFSFPGADLDELDSYVAAGIEAAEMAMRLGLPSLASGALDNAGSAWGATGNYLRTKPIWERRGEIILLVTDAFEVGDYWAMGAWMYFELGDYETAMRCIADGEAAVTSQGQDNIHIHLDAWKVAAQHRLGRWDEALEWFAKVRDLLDERRDRPPYFAAHAYGAAAQIHTARGDVAQSDRLTQILAPLLSGASGRLYPWLLRLHLLRGDVEAARALDRPAVWRVHAGDAYESESELVYAIGDRDRADALLVEMRRHGAASGTAPTVGPFANRLEGRLAMTDGDPRRAIQLLVEAVDGFDAIRCPFERAVTMLDLGSAQLADGQLDEGRAAFHHARETFDRLGAVRDLAIANERLRD